MTAGEQKSTWRQIRVYDGQGNLKKVVEPVFDYDSMKSPRKKHPEHECDASGCTVLTTKKNYCSKKCQTEVMKKREKNKRAEKNASRPKVLCAVCDAELVPRRSVYCSDSCSVIGTKIKMKEASERNKKKLKRKRGKLKMQNLNRKFDVSLKKIREEVRKLGVFLNVDTGLPDDLNSPCQHDAETVKQFAQVANDMAVEITSLSEELMVGDEVEKIWEEKPENCFQSEHEKLAEFGHKENQF